MTIVLRLVHDNHCGINRWLHASCHYCFSPSPSSIKVSSNLSKLTLTSTGYKGENISQQHAHHHGLQVSRVLAMHQVSSLTPDPNLSTALSGILIDKCSNLHSMTAPTCQSLYSLHFLYHSMVCLHVGQKSDTWYIVIVSYPWMHSGHPLAQRFCSLWFEVECVLLCDSGAGQRGNRVSGITVASVCKLWNIHQQGHLINSLKSSDCY